MENSSVIVSFCSRKSGNCEKIAKFAGETSKKAKVYLFSDFAIHPCGSCDYECFQHRETCPYYGDMECTLLDEICRSSIAYFIVPNYCDYPCANFFIFNERSQCYFQGRPDALERYLNVPKKFIVVSNGSQANFREVFTQHTADEPEILFLSAKRYGKHSITGDLLDSDDTRRDLVRFLK